jgi:hypothetical protein
MTADRRIEGDEERERFTGPLMARMLAIWQGESGNLLQISRI